MTYYIRGRCEDGTVYAVEQYGTIVAWTDHVDDASRYQAEKHANDILRNYQRNPNSWVYNVRVTER